MPIDWRGWNGVIEYVEKMHELSNPLKGLREEFGDDVYDRYLFATDQPNRVRVRSVIAGSAAQQAGIMPGDLVLGYAGNKIFSMQALRRATTEGLAGAAVLVDLLRNNQPFSVTVTRGPLGIVMESTRLSPG